MSLTARIVGPRRYRRGVEYREVPPPPALRGLVECGWIMGPPAQLQVQGVLPDGCMDLVWTGAELLVAGPDTVVHPFRRRPGHAGAGLRFAPGALPALLGVPASTVRDQRIPLAMLAPRPARAAVARLEQGAAALPTLAALAMRLPGEAPEPAIPAAAARLGSGATVGETAEAFGWTTRTLHRRCLAAFGYGPAVLRRIRRFRRAVAMLRTGVAPAEVAAIAGYADQPHLSREVLALAGTSPAQLASPRPRAAPQRPSEGARAHLA
jgi:AraC-like DNA-binding protein